jgi:chemotaxis protein methyltransferase CheR
MPTLYTDEWRLLAGYIQSICGIRLDETKQYLVESRLSSLLEQTRCLSYGELYWRARAEVSGSIERSIINAITTGETSFFRDGTPFQLLRQKLLPDLIARRAGAGGAKIPIRIWSAACSSGQEVYSIAMVLREALGTAEKYDIRLVGTDISPDAVQRANSGTYNSVEAGRGIDPALLSRYLQKQNDVWRVRDDVRALASFRTLNLLRDFSMLGEFDVIFCRNVAIYFSEADKTSLFDRVGRALAPHGALIIGSTESLLGICPQFVARQERGTVYYEKS